MLHLGKFHLLKVIFAAFALLSVAHPVQYAHATDSCDSIAEQLDAARAQLAALQAQRQSVQNAYASAITSCLSFEGDAYHFCQEAVNSYFWPLIDAIDQEILNQNALIDSLERQLLECIAGQTIRGVVRGAVRGVRAFY